MDRSHDQQTVALDRGGWKGVISGLLVGIAGCLVYVNTLGGDLIFDDRAIIPEQVARLATVAPLEIFQGMVWGDRTTWQKLYRPVMMVTLAGNYRINLALGLPGAHPVLYRLVNILLHGCVACVLWRLLRLLRLPPWACLAAGLLYAVHPIHTGAVALISNRGELLAAVFGLWFLAAYRRGAPWSPVLFALALGSKESAVALLPMAVWLDHCTSEDGLRRKAWRAVPAAAVLVLWLAIREWAVGHHDAVILTTDNVLVGASWLDRVRTVLAAQFTYLRLQLLPVGLSSDYGPNQVLLVTRFLDVRVWGALSAVALSAAWCLYRRRSRPAVSFAVGAYWLAVLPTSNLVYLVGTLMVERWLYLPSCFFCSVAAAALWEGLKGNRKAAWPALLVTAAALGSLTVARNRTWLTEAAFYTAQVRSAPASGRANQRIGLHYYRQGQLDSAIVYFRRTVTILPQLTEAWNDLGAALLDKGDEAAALEVFEWIHRIYPDYPQAHFNAARIYARQGRPQEAIADYRKAIQLKPDYPEAHNNLATLLAANGEVDSARANWKKALELRPDYDLARENLEILRKLQAGGRDSDR